MCYLWCCSSTFAELHLPASHSLISSNTWPSENNHYSCTCVSHVYLCIISCSDKILGTTTASFSSRTDSRGLETRNYHCRINEMISYWNVEPDDWIVSGLFLVCSWEDLPGLSWRPSWPPTSLSIASLLFSLLSLLNTSPIWSSSNQTKFFRSSLQTLP